MNRTMAFMNVDVLAVNVGNSRTALGAFVQGRLASSETILNEESDESIGQKLQRAYEPLRGRAEAAILLASVNPAMAQRVTRVAETRLGVTPRRVERDFKVPIGRQLDPKAIVGDDRLLTAAAAYDVLKQACVVVDAGTAVTIDFVDGAGTFHGGAILPGAQMMLNSLHEHTAQLPDVALARPDEPIGHNTVQAMLTAVYHGVRGTVRELVEQYAQVCGSFPVVVATGGDAELLFGDYELVERIVPDLGLRGIALTYQWATQAEA